MNTVTIIGVILIVVGAVGLIYGGITYTSSENIIDVGSMHVQVDQQRKIPLSPIAGAVALAAGVGLVVYGRRQPGRGSAL
jgi:hypothetical protein